MMQKLINLIDFPNCFNETFIDNFCGASDCQEDLNAKRLEYNSSDCPVTELQSGKPSSTLLYTLMGIYSAIALFGAAVVGVLVDPIQIR